MIYIEKTLEPESLRLHRGTPGSDFDGLDKKELRQALLEEQGYLCAYCMKRIRNTKDIKIEHYKARNKENELNYSNLLAVCNGNEGENRNRFTCDTMKGKQELHINPQSKKDMDTIYYDNQGKIYSRNNDYQNDLNTVLNLNDEYGYLIRNRKAALKAMREKLMCLKAGQDAMPLLHKLKNYCYCMNDDGELPEYAGILRWYVEKQIRKHS